MVSWRDTASAQVQDDLDGLLGPAIEFARQQLDERGEFYPYAVVLNIAGEQQMVAAGTGDSQPESTALIGALISAIAEDRNDLRAAAIVVDVHLRMTRSDAVRITLEHTEQVALSVLLPYRRRGRGLGIDYGEFQATAAAPSIWSAN